MEKVICNKIEELTKEYLDLLDIKESEARINAEYIYKNLIVKDETQTSFIGEGIKPIVKIVEYIENPEKTKKFVDYYEKFGKEPTWASDEDFGLKGLMLPYLSDQKIEFTDATVYYAIAESSGYNSQKGEPAVIISKIEYLEDLACS